MLKRITSFLLTVLMLVSMLCTITVANADTPVLAPAISANKTEILLNQGNTVEITVGVTGAEVASSYALTGHYDPNILKYKSYEKLGVEDKPNGAEGGEAATGVFGVINEPVNGDFEVYVISAANDTLSGAVDFYKLIFEVITPIEAGTQTDVDVELIAEELTKGDAEPLDPSEYSAAPAGKTITVRCEHDFTGVAYTEPAANTPINEAEHSRVCNLCKSAVVEDCIPGTPVFAPANATCDQERTKTTTCTECNYDYVETIPAGQHDWTDWLPAPDKHTHSRKCNVCDIPTQVEDCNITRITIPATHLKGEYIVITCDICGRHDETTPGAPDPHDDWTYIGNKTHKCSCGEVQNCTPGAPTYSPADPKCDEDQTVTTTCTGCGEVFRDIIPGGEHTAWSGWKHNKNANTHTRTCGDCGETETENCSTTTKTVPATHLKGSYKVTTCSKCDRNDQTTPGKPAAHDAWKYYKNETHKCSCGTVQACSYKVTKKATCSAKGEKQCKVCGHKVSTPTVAANHPTDKLVIRYKEPTKSKAGYIRVTCSACDTRIKSDDYKYNNASLAKGKQFNDISSNTQAWFYSNAVFVKSFGGLMTGDENKNFNGNANVTRGQVVTILGRYLFGRLEDMSTKEFNALMKDLKADGFTPGSFKDLKSQYYSRYAKALSALGVVNGRDDGTFDGDNLVNRQELAAFLMRFIKLDLVSNGKKLTFGDAVAFKDQKKVDDWAKSIVKEAGKCGLFGGDENKNFNPKSSATRGEVATVMMRIIRATAKYPIVDV